MTKSNARAKALRVKNIRGTPSAGLNAAWFAVKTAQEQLTKQLREDYPAGMRVTVENVWHENRQVTGPVHCTGLDHSGWPQVFVVNEKTGVIRRFSAVGDYIFPAVAP